MSEEIQEVVELNIYQKLIEVRKVVPYLQKGEQGSQYQYTGSSRVLTAVVDKLNELGLLLVPAITKPSVHESTIEYTETDRQGNSKPKRTTTYFTELEMTMTWINAEKPDETISVPWYGQGVDIAGEKGVGKALTYAEKYFMLKFFNIATDKDDPDAFQQKHDQSGEETPNTQTTTKTSKPSQPATTEKSSGTTPQTISAAQIGYCHKLKKDKGINDPDFMAMVSELGNGKSSIKDMTKQEASAFITLLNNYAA